MARGSRAALRRDRRTAERRRAGRPALRGSTFGRTRVASSSTSASPATARRSSSRSSTSAARPAPAPACPRRRGEEQVPVRARRAALVRRRGPRGGTRRDGRRDGEGGAAAAGCPRRLVERARPKDPFRRRNAAYVRQGEWFFVPAAGIDRPMRARPARRAAHARARHAARDAVRLSPRRRCRLRQPPASDRDQRGTLRAADAGAAAKRRLDAARARSRGVCEGHGPSSGPRHGSSRRLAPRADEHRAGRTCHAARRVPRLTGAPGDGRPPFRDRLTGRTPRSERGDRGSIPCPGFRGPDS